jgi:prepilin-type N-terminal cleavage/methylation domain-containing protein
VNARGFSLLELVVVVVIVGVMAGFALDRLLPLIGRAERAAFFQVQSQLKSALLLEAAERLTSGESATLPELAGVNPMTLLLDAPGNYLGSFDGPEHARVPRARWYYDERTGRLMYRVGKHTRFMPLEGPEDRVELVVEFVYEDVDGDAAYSASVDEFDGLRLASVHAYDWPD